MWRWLLVGLTASVVTVVIGLVAPGVVQAQTSSLEFGQWADGTASVSAIDYNWSDGLTHHLELRRDGTVIAATPESTKYVVSVNGLAPLLAGDLLLFFDGAAVRASATYDGTPSVNADACLGNTVFTGAATPGTDVVAHANPHPLLWDMGSDTAVISRAGASYSATMPRPLNADGDLMVTATVVSNDVLFQSSRSVKLAACPAPMSAPTAPAPAISVNAAPTDTQVARKIDTALAIIRRQLARIRPRTLAHKANLPLTFALPEAGAATLTLRARTGHRKITLGSGSATRKSAGQTVIKVKLTNAGRDVLAHAKRLSVTLRSVFDPARTGANTHSQKLSTTLKDR
jgi:hypothetical protein